MELRYELLNIASRAHWLASEAYLLVDMVYLHTGSTKNYFDSWRWETQKQRQLLFSWLTAQPTYETPCPIPLRFPLSVFPPKCMSHKITWRCSITTLVSSKKARHIRFPAHGMAVSVSISHQFILSFLKIFLRHKRCPVKTTKKVSGLFCAPWIRWKTYCFLAAAVSGNVIFCGVLF